MKKVLLVIFTILFYPFKGLIVQILWGWFIVPTFHLPPISVPVAIGIGSIIGALAYQNDSDDEREFEKILLSSYVILSIFFTAGFVAHLFM